MKINFTKVTDFIKKNAYVLVIIAVGAVLILLPVSKNAAVKEEATEEREEAETGFSLEAEEERIRSLLEGVDGVGAVSVRLSVSGTEETVYMEDKRLGSEGREESTTTVTVSRGSGVSEALVVRKIKPEYVGCVVACSGAESDAVRLRVTQAVMSLTGLSADKITVLKSK